MDLQQRAYGAATEGAQVQLHAANKRADDKAPEQQQMSLKEKPLLKNERKWWKWGKWWNLAAPEMKAKLVTKQCANCERRESLQRIVGIAGAFGSGPAIRVMQTFAITLTKFSSQSQDQIQFLRWCNNSSNISSSNSNSSNSNNSNSSTSNRTAVATAVTATTATEQQQQQ
ncbi:hypothetical protein FHG87_015974 [Trinorchestia longiramus]|nr:hypothetical protein FHG87_015974 [Trinorchestia longiramus]